jgi:hypothetical protein
MGATDVIKSSSEKLAQDGTYGQSYLGLIDLLRDDVQNKLGDTQTPTLLGQQNRVDEMFPAGWTSSKPGG